MKTFYCWLIANFELIMYIFLLILSAIILFGFSDKDNTLNIFMYLAVLMGILSLPTKKGVFQFGKYLLIVGFGIMMNDPKYDNNEFMSIFIPKFWIVFIITSIISAFIAVYTYMNIDEVLSRRMLYRNSNVSIFEYSWLYTLDRFCSISISIIACTFWLWGLILFNME